MAGSTNFQIWNPTQANQETDSAYLVDAQRTGGAPNGTPFPSQTGNKLFYQLSVGITSLMNMMAAKGFVVNDTNPATLASVLSAIQTTADVKTPLQTVSGVSGAFTAQCNQFQNFELHLVGNVTITPNGQTPGQILVFEIFQPSGGGCTVSIPSAVGEVWVDTTGSAPSSMQFMVVSDSSLRAIGPGISANGINGTPIGQNVAANGRFNTLVALGQLTCNTLAVTANGTVGGTLNIVGITTGSKFLANGGSGTTGGYGFVGDIATGLFQAAPGVLILYCNGTGVIAFNSAAATVSVPIAFNLPVNVAAGGSFSGNISGNPNFTGTPLSTTPPTADSSQRIATTAFVSSFGIQAVIKGQVTFTSQTFSNSAVTYLIEQFTLPSTPANTCCVICTPQSPLGDEVQYTAWFVGNQLFIKVTHGAFNLPYTVPSTLFNYRIVN